MTLKRLSPLIHQYDLGYVQLWRDELAEIVRLTRQLDGADVRIEADDYLIDDVETDLPKVGSSRLSSFRVIATRTTDGPTLDLLEVDLTQRSCQIKAADPDLTTLGAIDAIRSLTERCRRIPRQTARLLPRDMDLSRFNIFVFSVLVGGAAWFLGDLVAGGILELRHSKYSHIPAPVEIFLIVVGVLFFFMTLSIFLRAGSVLHTGTRAEAPTFWQEHRADIAINIGVSVIFFLLGLLVSHL